MKAGNSISVPKLYLALYGVYLLCLLAACATGPSEIGGTISGRVTPDDASVRIIAKISGTDYEKPGNIKGEVTLTKGGNFQFDDLPPGNYDLLFFLLGESKERYIASSWSEVIVEAGKITEGINYRLTPMQSTFMIDEILVIFINTNDTDARKAIKREGFIVKDAPFSICIRLISLMT